MVYQVIGNHWLRIFWCFLVPKPNRWRPILDPSTLNKFLKAEKFKMETPETVRTSLQPGKWVMSIDFKDSCIHIPIKTSSGSTYLITFKVNPASSKHYHLVCPQHPWNSPGLGSNRTLYLSTFVLKYIFQSTKMYLSTFSNSKYMYLNCT